MIKKNDFLIVRKCQQFYLFNVQFIFMGDGE